MRWKLLRRRLSVSAPRMIVRSHLPWPLRWAATAVMLGFSAAIAMWAFEFGKEIAGLDRGARTELARLQDENARLRDERDRAQSVANTADSLLKAERSTQDRLAEQIRQLEAQNLSLKGDLGFFERLLPATDKDGAVAVRGLQAQVESPGRVRYQLLVMQSRGRTGEFQGRYELQLSGTMDGKPWIFALPGGPHRLAFKHYQRVDGLAEVPVAAQVRQALVKVIDPRGTELASERVPL